MEIGAKKSYFLAVNLTGKIYNLLLIFRVRKNVIKFSNKKGKFLKRKKWFCIVGNGKSFWIFFCEFIQFGDNFKKLEKED